MPILLGAIADDFTGATDLCNTLVKEGMRTVQVIGVPDAGTEIGDADAVVVALKTRTMPVDQAVNQSLAAYDWLAAQGASQVIEKYCSTFDSTPEGNIGPITDALMDRSGTDIAVVCPAFPENGRTVYKGHLFVGIDLLSDSPMKHHPLTPMRDASLVRLMEAQSRGTAGVVPLQTVRRGAKAVRATLTELAGQDVRYAVADAIDETDLRTIGAALDGQPLVTGGSGIALGLPGNFRASGVLGEAKPPSPPRLLGRRLVLAGFCSVATRAQIAQAEKAWPSRCIEMDAVADGRETVEAITDWAASQPDGVPVLIFSSADPDVVRASQAKYGVQQAGEMIEQTLSGVGAALVPLGFRSIVVAGGETSGAVVSALGIKALRIGSEIAPGVPWTETTEGSPIALALKSGNFGAETFFGDAFEMLT